MQADRVQSPRSSRARIASLAIALLALAPLFFAAAASAAGGTLDRVKESGRIRLGYRADAPPLSFRDGSGKVAGYSVELCQLVVEAVKADLRMDAVAVEWVPLTVESRFRALQSGEVDLLCGAESVTLARRAEVSFSIPTFPGGVGALLRADSAARLRELLAGRQPQFQPTWRANAGQVLLAQKFEVVAGTTAELWVTGKGAEFDLNFAVSQVDSYDAGVRRLLDGQADVFFGDRVLLLAAKQRSPSADDMVVLDRLFTAEPLALALPRGDEDFRLLIDRTLSWLYGSGKAAELYGKWCGKADDATIAFYKANALPE